MIDRMRSQDARRQPERNAAPEVKATCRDRYYTAARRLHWRQVMRGLRAG